MNLNVDHLSVCRICFATDCKLYHMTKYEILYKAYEALTGLLMENEDRMPPYLCIECAQALLTSDYFRSKSLRAHCFLLGLVKEHGRITENLIRSINSDTLPNTQSLLSSDFTSSLTDKYELNVEWIKKEDTISDDCAGTSGDVDASGAVGGDVVKTEREEVTFTDAVTANGVTVYISSLKDDIDDFKVEESTLPAGKHDSSDDSLPLGEVKQGSNVESTTVQEVLQVDPPLEPKTSELSTGGYRCASRGAYTCTLCPYKTMNKRSLASHLKAHSAQKPYSCSACKKSFSQKSVLEAHARDHAAVRAYSCDVCNRTFSAKANLQRHFSKICSAKPFTCDLCRKTFSEKDLLKIHLRMHFGQKPYPCDVCTVAFGSRSELREHLREHAGATAPSSPHACSACNKMFVHKSSLTDHLKRHKAGKPHSCDLCDEAFDGSDELERHLREHCGAKPFSCEVCKTVFSRKNNLKVHQQRHSGQRPHVCHVCSKTFSRTGYLNKHLRTHSGARTHRCDACGATFNQKSNLRRHYRKHSGVKPYACDACSKTFSRQDLLQIHTRAHAGGAPAQSVKGDLTDMFH